MIKIYKTSTVEKKLKKIKKITTDSWISLVSPTMDEIDKVVNKTKVDKDTIISLAGKLQRGNYKEIAK